MAMFSAIERWVRENIAGRDVSWPGMVLMTRRWVVSNLTSLIDSLPKFKTVKLS